MKWCSRKIALGTIPVLQSHSLQESLNMAHNCWARFFCMGALKDATQEMKSPFPNKQKILSCSAKKNRIILTKCVHAFAWRIGCQGNTHHRQKSDEKHGFEEGFSFLVTFWHFRSVPFWQRQQKLSSYAFLAQAVCFSKLEYKWRESGMCCVSRSFFFGLSREAAFAAKQTDRHQRPLGSQRKGKLTYRAAEGYVSSGGRGGGWREAFLQIFRATRPVRGQGGFFA